MTFFTRRMFCTTALAGGIVGLVPGRATASPSALPAPGTKHGVCTVGGKTIAWSAKAGETPLKLSDNTLGGTLFTVAYTGHVADKASRPVIFIWNGGPGGASWPLRRELAPRTFIAAPHSAKGFTFINNPNSLIDAADLVFIDAPGTGFSRVFSEQTKDAFWGTDGDARVISRFIENWMRDNRRETSPLFLLGESYGGTRAVEVAGNLTALPQGTLDFRGMILVSPALTGTSGQEDNPAFAQFVLPTEACTAAYHRRGGFAGADMAKITEIAESCAERLNPVFRAGIAAPPVADRSALVKLTGLPEPELVKHNWRIGATTFRDTLLKDQNLQVNQYDGRATRPLPKPGEKVSPVDTNPDFDLNQAIVESITLDLNYKTTQHYNRNPVEIFNHWRPSKLPDSGRSARLGKLIETKSLKVCVFAGYFDFAVPYMFQKHELDQLHLPASRLSFHLFGCGHGVFEDMKLRPQTTAMARRFLIENA